jgi:hypothetical protein
MSLNPFFLQGSITEQGLIQDLVNEQLRMYGVEVYYIPRIYFSEKTIIKEVIESQFKDAYPIEAYVDTYEGYNGAGTLLSKFGIQELDDMTIIISRERYEVYLKPLLQNLPDVKLYDRPKEGDLIYFPLGDRLFEIKYVEHEKPFYQLKKNYVYELRCELFRYSNEVLDTGISNIDDNVEYEGYTQTLQLVGIGSIPSAYSGIVDGGIRYITLSNRGKGYKYAPEVKISSSLVPGGNAAGIATMIGGLSDLCEPNSNSLRIQGVELTSVGYGYTVAPLVTFVGGKGNGAVAKATLGNGIVGFITITNGGYGYVDPPIVTISNPGSSSLQSASGIGNINPQGSVTSVSITNNGIFYAPYSSQPVTFQNPPINTARITPTILKSKISSLNIDNVGSGYTFSPLPLISFTGGGITTSTYKYGLSSGYIDGNNQDIIYLDHPSDVLRGGRVDFWIKIDGASLSGDLISGNGIYGSNEWKIQLNSNKKIQLSILNGLEIVEVPVIINDGEWHFVSFQKPQNIANISGNTYTIISVDGTSVGLFAAEPNFYINSEGISIKNSVNTKVYIDSFRIQLGHSNYDNSVPSTQFSSDVNTLYLSNFEHALVSPIITNGTISSTTISSFGSGYSSEPVVTISQPTVIETATGITSVDYSGKIASIIVVNPGFGYSTSPIVSVASTNPLRQTAIARAHINSSGIVTQISITNSGVGYTVAPSITFSNPPSVGIGTYIFNEVVIGSASSTQAKVKSWNSVTRQLTLYNITGQFLSGELIVGQTSGSNYPIKIINTDNLQDKYAENYQIQIEANDIVDFSEKNPFGIV